MSIEIFRDFHQTINLIQDSKPVPQWSQICYSLSNKDLNIYFPLKILHNLKTIEGNHYCTQYNNYCAKIIVFSIGFNEIPGDQSTLVPYCIEPLSRSTISHESSSWAIEKTLYAIHFSILWYTDSHLHIFTTSWPQRQ